MVCSGTVVFYTRETSRELFQNDSFIVPPNVAHSLKVNAETRLAVLCLNPEENIEKNVSDLMSVLCQVPDGCFAEGGLSPSDSSRLQELAKQLSEQPDFVCADAVFLPPIQAVVKMLQEKPEEPYSLDEMASLAGHSRWHFLRLFQQEVGLTPHAYLMLCRLRLLRSLLRTDMPAAEAAVSTGFSDQSHMHRVFKLHHGLTPKQFREASISLEP